MPPRKKTREADRPDSVQVSVRVGKGRWIVPALSATMGDWVYYAAVVSLGEIAARVEFAEVLHGRDRNLNELIQRDLDNRSAEIAEYLIRQKKERFFNSLVIGLYEGNPDWYYASLRMHERLSVAAIPEYGREALGLLVFDGTEQLFALDGQHRVAGIKQAIKTHPSLQKEFITVLFVPHDNTAAGLQRTRRLFTTLNRYAKPVAKARLIALDEDDGVAIVTRRLIAEEPLFLNRTSTKQPKSIPPTDQTNVTTIGTLYDAMNAYLRHVLGKTRREWAKYKRERPSDDEIEELTQQSRQLWNRLSRAIPAYRAILTGVLPGTFRRKEDGGDLWVRPIGMMILIDILVEVRADGRTEVQAIHDLVELPSLLSDPPWNGLLWDPQNHRMITRGENRRVATALGVYLCGGDLPRLKFTEATLQREWSGLVGERRRLDQL